MTRADDAYTAILACTHLLDAFNTNDCNGADTLGDLKNPFNRSGLIAAIRLAAHELVKGGIDE